MREDISNWTTRHNWANIYCMYLFDVYVSFLDAHPIMELFRGSTSNSITIIVGGINSTPTAFAFLLGNRYISKVSDFLAYCRSLWWASCMERLCFVRSETKFTWYNHKSCGCRAVVRAFSLTTFGHWLFWYGTFMVGPFVWF